jgi:hypothetical protein
MANIFSHIKKVIHTHPITFSVLTFTLFYYPM